jgi:hypothetical protein
VEKLRLRARGVNRVEGYRSSADIGVGGGLVPRYLVFGVLPGWMIKAWLVMFRYHDCLTIYVDNKRVFAFLTLLENPMRQKRGYMTCS